MKNVIFLEKMRLADLITACPNLILMLPRFGIPLGFGEASVATVCHKHNVPTDFFLLICNVYSFCSYIPDSEIIAQTDMQMLVPYLQASHNYYMHERLPHIENHLNHLAECAGNFGEVLTHFFADYKHEVADHFAYEETIVFPYLDKLEKHLPQGKYSISDFKHSHSNLEDKLGDLTQIVFKYLPGNILPEESIELVFDVLQLSTDLNKHALIEEKILVPYVEGLERRLT